MNGVNRQSIKDTDAQEAHEEIDTQAFHCFSEVRHGVTVNPSNFISRKHPKKKKQEILTPPKPMQNLHTSLTHRSKEVETTQMPTNLRTNAIKMWYSHVTQ